MSDQAYREQAARRTRTLLIAAGVLLSIACIVFGVVSIFRDDCTGSFARDPQTVITSYITGIQSGDAGLLRKCWLPKPYFDLETGCSEICLSRVLGADFQLVAINLEPEKTTPGGRGLVRAEVTIACTGDGDEHIGEIQLDSLAANVPWKHWKIARSTIGGSPAQVWCKP